MVAKLGIENTKTWKTSKADRVAQNLEMISRLFQQIRILPMGL